MEKNFSKISNKIRLEFLKLLELGYKYHIGGTASCIDLLTVLFYGNFINLNQKNRSKFILSKGHALGGLHAIFLDKNITSKKKLEYMKKNGKIGGQLDIYIFKDYIDWNTGSLGHSIGVITGMAISNPNQKVWTIVGDAEMDEGSIWEAIFFISERKINNIIIVIDRNKISASAKIEKKEFLDKKILDKLNFNIYRINGHDHKEIYNTFKKFKNSSRSTIVIADTIKGKGFGIAENNLAYSHQSLDVKTLSNIKKKYE
jgi:transketolase